MKAITWIWFYELWAKCGLFDDRFDNGGEKIKCYQDTARIYLDEYDEQGILRESWFANRIDWISVIGNKSSFQNRFNKAFYQRN